MAIEQYLRQLKEQIELLSDSKTSKGDYCYPVTDEKTAQKLEVQDSGMRQREQTIYRNLLRNRSGLLIDFGCGKGANLKCFDCPENTDAVLLGIELDPARYEAALSRLKLLQYVEGLIVNSDVSFLSKIPPNIAIDSILCSQVLGHLSKTELERILTAFASSIKSGGQCLISVPIVGEAFSSDPSAHGWQPGSDYLHVVNFDLSPFDVNYRIQVDSTNFNKIASNPPKNVLPVRCFWIEDLPSEIKLDLPIELNNFPPTLRDLIESHFEVESIYLYSAHKLKSGVIGIGDILVVLKFRSL